MCVPHDGLCAGVDAPTLRLLRQIERRSGSFMVSQHQVGATAPLLTGRTALVTGSTSGIGLAIARALAREGANIVVNGFGDRADIRSIEEELQDLGVEAAFDGADLRDIGAIEDMVRAAEARFGCVDVVVNNAGIQHVAPIEAFPVDRWDDILAVNLSAAFHTIRLTLPAMRVAGWGRILNIASAHGLVASTEKAAYIAAKHGLIGLTKTVALETAQSAITCNAICPGWVLTPLTRVQIQRRADDEGISFDDAAVAVMRGKQPSEAFVSLEDIGALAVFLCSPAANQVRGVAWSIDGGWTAQ
jgi:3-hydroxybutyrate dehydrogenase